MLPYSYPELHISLLDDRRKEGNNFALARTHVSKSDLRE
jgi:hypothetical protein